MSASIGTGWQVAAFFLHLAGAVSCAIAALWLARKAEAPIPHRAAMLWALATSALWCVTIAAFGTGSALAGMTEACRNIAWLAVVYRLFAADGRHQNIAPVRPMVASLVFVEILQLVLVAIVVRSSPDPATSAFAVEIGAAFRVLVAVGALVLLHNLYVGAAPATRHILRWPAAALGGLWAYELNLYTVGYLGGGLVELLALRGIVLGMVAVALVFGGDAAAQGRRLSPSRAVAFRTLSLAVIGSYLLLMSAISFSLSIFGEGVQRLTQVGFLVAAAVVALLWLPSRKLRGWWRTTLVKHLFQHRYDYRAEWLRFTQTMGQGGPEHEGLAERAVRAMADATDSPSGLLLMPGEDGAFALAARWRSPSIQVPAVALSTEFAIELERDGRVVDLDAARAGGDASGPSMVPPDWLLDTAEVWALVPLMHFGRLQGVVVLSRPTAPRRLDWEDFDLLRVIGRQLASYLAEKAGQEELMEARQFDEFNRRIAFVMHDVKNLASQLSLLARNAELHADKPAFRADMLVTLRNSADKLNALLARLGRYGSNAAGTCVRTNLREMAGRVRARLAEADRVVIVGGGEIAVLADPDGLEQALVHLVQNAIDAAPAESPVRLALSSDGIRGRIEVIDAGAGMTADFVREGLFKPFVSSKQSGFGIGAFEARELVRAMGGRLDVESRVGIGSRFTVSLPLVAAQELIRNNAGAIADGAEIA